MSRIYLKKRKKKCLNVTELMLNWFHNSRNQPQQEQSDPRAVDRLRRRSGFGVRSMTRIPVEICEIRGEKSAVPLTKLERWRVISAHPRAAERGPETIATYEAHSLAVGPHTREIEDLRFS